MDLESQFKCGRACMTARLPLLFNLNKECPDGFSQAILEKSREIFEYFDEFYSQDPNELLPPQRLLTAESTARVPTPKDDRFGSDSTVNFAAASKVNFATPSKAILATLSEGTVLSPSISLAREAKDSWRTSEKRWLMNAPSLTRVFSSAGPPTCPAGVCGQDFVDPDFLRVVAQCQGRPLLRDDQQRPPTPKRPSTAPVSCDPCRRDKCDICHASPSSRNSSRDGKARTSPAGGSREGGKRPAKQLTGVMRPFSASSRQHTSSGQESSTAASVGPERPFSGFARLSAPNSRPASAGRPSSAAPLSARPACAHDCGPSPATRPSTVRFAMENDRPPTRSLKGVGPLFEGFWSKPSSSAQKVRSATWYPYRSHSLVRSLMNSGEVFNEVPISKYNESGTKSKIVRSHLSNLDDLSPTASSDRRRDDKSTEKGGVSHYFTYSAFPPHFYNRPKSSGLYGTFPGDKPPPLPYKPPHQAMRPDRRR